MDLTKFNDLDIVVVCGLPGAGKSHFSKAYFEKTNRQRVSRSEIRRFLYEMTHFGAAWQTELFKEESEFLVKHTERKILEQLLQEKQKVLIDNTSVTVDSRKRYLELARTLKKSIGALFIHNPVQVCLKRNKQNKFGVPDIVISNLSTHIELPSTKEGFKEVMIIKDY